MRILVAGIGNIFLGDDAFGVEVVRRLGPQPLGEQVTVADFGIRGTHLSYELASGQYDGVVLVDAMARGGEPGSLYAIEPDLDSADVDAVALDAHSLTPSAVLAWVRQIGGCVPHLAVVGCEPATVEESMALSPQVEASIERAMLLVREVVSQMMEALSCV